MKLDHRVADPLEHPPHDSVPSLVDHDPQHGAGLLVAERTDLLRADRLSVDDHPGPQPLQGRGRRVPVDEHLIFFLQLEARMSDPIEELTVVGHQQQAGRVSIQAADGDDALWHLHQIHDRAPSALVTRRSDVAVRLVEHQVTATLPADELAIDAHLLVRRIDADAQLTHDLAVHGDAPLEDQLLGPAAGCDAALRNHAL
jgi:hypothetical protein